MKLEDKECKRVVVKYSEHYNADLIVLPQEAGSELKNYYSEVLLFDQ